MFHTIEFTLGLEANSLHDRRQPLLLQPGDCLPAQLRPHVVESANGPVEAADLLLEDGTVLADVPFAFFRFVDRQETPCLPSPERRDGRLSRLLLTACILVLLAMWPLVLAFRLALDCHIWLRGESAAD
jgi:hypothetical protein